MSAPRQGPRARQPGPATISVIFLLFGAVWMAVTSEVFLSGLIRDPALLSAILAWKDWAFLAVAALLLYLLVRHYARELSRSETLYRTLVETSGSIILTMDRDGNITFFNRRAEEVFGFPRREILGKNVVGTIVPATESSGRDLDQMMQDLTTVPGKFLKNRNENVTAKGKRVWVNWTNRALWDEKGFPVGVVSVGTEEGG